MKCIYLRVEEERIVAGYVQLYSQARLDTLDALDRMMELRQAEELKSKLLFSIIVVRARMCEGSFEVFTVIPFSFHSAQFTR